MTSHAPEAPVEAAPNRVIPVPVSGLRITQLDFDLYLRPEPCEPPRLFRGREYPLASDDLNKLRDRGIETLYVAAHEYEAYRAHVLDGLANDSSMPPAERFHVTREVYRMAFETAFQGDTLQPMLEFSQEFGGDLTQTICDDDTLMSDLYELMEHDGGTYTHCVNVSTYALVLAKALGIDDPAELRSLATGAILHDIGKRRVQLGIINKPGPLTAEQRAEIELHPLIGFRELVLEEDAAWGPLMMVYQHHERMDGQGYPVGVAGRDIHEWARMCSVADVFHAVTSHRPYRKPMSAAQAMQFLETQAGTMFDPEMVRCWNTTLRN